MIAPQVVLAHIRLANILIASHVLPRLLMFTPTYPPFYPNYPYST